MTGASKLTGHCEQLLPDAKCPLEHRLWLIVETKRCGELLPQLFALLAEAGQIPTETEYECDGKGTRISILIDVSRLVSRAGLLCRVEALKDVQCADYLDHRRRVLEDGWQCRILPAGQ